MLKQILQAILLFTVESLICLESSYGQEASRLGDLNAIRILEARANAGNAKAQYLLGEIYWKGIGVAPDENKAAMWAEKGALQNDPSSEDLLGIIYSSGMGGKKQDCFKAFEWTQKAALQGESDAQAHLGRMYQRGAGVDRDCRKAKYWLEKASMQSNGEAENALGNMYKYGDCFEINPAEALKLYKKACAHDYPWACGKVSAKSDGKKTE